MKREGVLAFMPVYNEIDILLWSLTKLDEQGVNVMVLDNWSQDGSYEFVKDMPVVVERFPAQGPSDTYDWTEILKRIEGAAMEPWAQQFAWAMLIDADEIRRAPFAHYKLTLKEAFELAESEGATLAEFAVRHYRPVDNGWRINIDPEQYFEYYEPHTGAGNMVKAWKVDGGRVHLADTGGHGARHDRSVNSVWPYPFISKHYPIRTQEQGERKVFRDRVPRWNKKEREKSWHQQYNHFHPGCQFIRSPSDPNLERDPRVP